MATHRIYVRGEKDSFECDEKTTILEAALEHGLNISYSCQAGTCSSCAAILTSGGSVDQSDQSFLDEDQMNNGFILPCVCYPQSDCEVYFNAEVFLVDEPIKEINNEIRITITHGPLPAPRTIDPVRIIGWRPGEILWRGNGYYTSGSISPIEKPIINKIDEIVKKSKDILEKIKPEEIIKFISKNPLTTAIGIAMYSAFRIDSLNSNESELLASIRAESMGIDIKNIELNPGNKNTIEMKYRGIIKPDFQHGYKTLMLMRTDGKNIPSSVPIRYVESDQKSGSLSFTTDDGSITLTWSPEYDQKDYGYRVTVSPAWSYQSPTNTGGQIIISDSVTTTTTPVPLDKEWKDYVLIFPDNTGLDPIYIMLDMPYGATTRGEFSGRSYNPDKSGGPTQSLEWKEIKITQAGIDKVKLHTGRFGSVPSNDIMIDRLEKILSGELDATDIDKRFYTHEIRELERYRVLGVKDGVAPDDAGETWNNTHTATLEDYKVKDDHTLLYTHDALQADE
ncbi:S-type pyocin domain-containing protein [Pectobacterium sp. A535-S3-A17]|uniref:S-type pyocin domain-containing protein n=1 Tax=Pectobacterium quasiaquaticum TaxID=2774015 RepID=UPI0018739A1E|nr:S-type pyocin domain-containing protein [Pectobacterium quasiaquaticum]MBE5215239.1 S-type pyocin domain-containing protein [Pectobacterium quasiaquaticum]MBE5225091.1 S-type pyocin domain-containing protein [Pectobacterium quasiaquaticum]